MAKVCKWYHMQPSEYKALTVVEHQTLCEFMAEEIARANREG